MMSLPVGCINIFCKLQQQIHTCSGLLLETNHYSEQALRIDVRGGEQIPIQKSTLQFYVIWGRNDTPINTANLLH